MKKTLKLVLSLALAIGTTTFLLSANDDHKTTDKGHDKGHDKGTDKDHEKGHDKGKDKH